MLQLTLPIYGSNKVSKQDICDELGVTMVALMSAIYSGRLPNPTDVDTWDEEHVRPFINNWRAYLKSKHQKLSTSCVKSHYPVHTR
jgi:hypothetical protein